MKLNLTYLTHSKVALKVLGSIALALAAGTATAQDKGKADAKGKKESKSKKPAPPAWLKTVSTAPAGDFALPKSGEYTFQAGVPKFENAGQMKLTLTNAGATIKAQGVSGSVGAAEAAWAYKSEFVSVVKTDGLKPQGFEQSESDPKEDNTYAVEFKADGTVSGAWDTVHKDGKTEEEKRKKEFKYEGVTVHDTISAFLYLRSQPLKDGDKNTVLVYTGRDLYLVTATVTGRGKAPKGDAEVDAIQIGIEASKVDKKDVLKPMNDNLKSATVLISDDADRIPLGLNADIVLGSVNAKLIEAK